MKGSAQKFLNKAIINNSKPKIINIDKSGTNTTGIQTWNKRSMTSKKIKILPIKYLNNIVEQDHRSIKRRITIATGFKKFESVKRTPVGIEIACIIRKGQILNLKTSTFKTFRL